MEDKKIISKFCNEIWSYVAKSHIEKPLKSLNNELFHYTDSKGLLGILETNKLWASEAEYLNDSMELYYGKRITKEIIDEEVSNAEDNIKIELLNITLENFKVKYDEVYIACFCENGDLLSQWRSYSSFGHGYAIGFNSEMLQRKYRPSPACNIMIKKIIYDYSLQKKLIKGTINKIYDSLKKYINPNRKEIYYNLMENAGLALWSSLENYTYWFKAPSFLEEQEWRAIFINSDYLDEGRQEVKFRVSNENITPYMELDLSPSAGGKGIAKLAINKIICGPKTNFEQTKKAINILTSQNGFINIIEVVKSNITLR